MLGERPQIEMLILAAGASKRLGQPKQFIIYKGETLIRRIVKEALEADLGPVTVVAGHQHDKVKEEINDLEADVFYNKEWKEGLGASIRNGLKYVLSKNPDTNALILSAVDQPFVNADHLRKLADTYDPARNMIVASAYGGTFGVPVLVDSFYFDELKQLKGDEGGKKIFANYIKDIIEIPFIEGSIDIDEKEDLDALNEEGPE